MLKLEITESAVMAEVELAVAKLQALKALGVGLALDDFGTGHSSLAYLKRFPVDTLKVDKAFLEGLTAESQAAAIVRNIVALAKSLDLSVTAEGIETHTQLHELQAMACDRGQGFLFAKPLTVEAVSAVLEQQDALATPDAA